MIEGLIIIIGLCITFLPVLFYVNYLLTHVSRKTRFDYHIELVKDKAGDFGVILAYAERILLGTVICLLGITMSEFFTNEFIFHLFVISLIAYVIVKFFDEKNEK